MAIDVSVVVVSYNRKRFLKKCLECLLWQDYPEDNYEIIVVDDGSTDGTDKMFEMMDYPQRVRYFCSPERLGQSKARNRGIFEAKGEVIIFTDSDAFAPPWFIREHMVWHQKDSKLIVDGPAINVSGENYLKEPPFDSSLVKILAFFDFWGASFITVNTSCRRENLIKVGGFDEDFEGLGWHDWELGYRLTKIGLFAKRNVNAIVYHYKEKRDLSNLKELMKRRIERGKNAVLYYKKHPTLFVKLQIRAHQLLTDKFTWWLDTSSGDKILGWARENDKFLFNLLINLKLKRAYVKGLREGMKRHKVKIWPWMQV